MSKKSTENVVSNEKINKIYDFIGNIVDKDTFIEIDALVRSETSIGTAYGEGVVSGFAMIADTQVGIFATNPEVLKGSIGKRNAAKIVKCIENAIKTRSPIIAVLDTSGARISEGIDVMEGYGMVLNSFNKAYGSIPTFCVVKGNNFGMLSYMTTCCDICIAYEKAVIATASPLILAAKTKYDASIIGTSGVHSQQSGIISITIKSDSELKANLFKLVNLVSDVYAVPTDDPNRLCTTLKNGSNAKDIIAEVFDKDTFIELRSIYAKEVVTGLARLNGISIGIVATNPVVNEGKLSANAAIKISELVTTCENFNIPVVNIVDSEGVRKNLESENTTLIRELGNLLFVYTNLSTVKVSMITGNAIGLGYVALASKSVFDYTVAWENANITMIDNNSATTLLYSDEISKGGLKADKDKITKELSEVYRSEQCSAKIIAERGYLDNVIKPSHSRQYLIAGVQMFLSKR